MQAPNEFHQSSWDHSRLFIAWTPQRSPMIAHGPSGPPANTSGAADGGACCVQKGVAALAEGTPAASAADDAGVAYVYALRGAVARVGRLAMQESWNTDLAADERVRASLHDVVAARVSGRPLPAEIVTDAVQALFFLLVVDVQRVHRMVGGRGGMRAGMSQVGTQAEVTAVAASARSFVQRVRVHAPLICGYLHAHACIPDIFVANAHLQAALPPFMNASSRDMNFARLLYGRYSA